MVQNRQSTRSVKPDASRTEVKCSDAWRLHSAWEAVLRRRACSCLLTASPSRPAPSQATAASSQSTDSWGNSWNRLRQMASHIISSSVGLLSQDHHLEMIPGVDHGTVPFPPKQCPLRVSHSSLTFCCLDTGSLSPSLSFTNSSCYEHSCINLAGNTCFCFSCINTKEQNNWGV